ncbi:UDP-N-acetylglucosamine--N-acetylmuramyl-(pentapeptide) pyrophosphoryl-undecaprenol N-acetylglucosamine transferase [Candidatus Gottesmanbacteria bacterium]|nr:UDP-N-acetylglucosamine--N-acetylmuramyl-(pentapeptide) pyrophosphoryl-undecaprenol N-acetylglucosamine transferase [Candidatus Gottesmanbacteria bacterium]
MKILITGGHVTPAIAVIEEIQKRFPDWEIVFVGRKYAMVGEKEVSAEYRLISDLGIRFLSLTTGRSTPVRSLLKISFGLVQALWYVFKEKPAIIVSFGGYIAFPVVIAGWILGIPSLTHEQTRIAGGANLWIAKIAKKVCVSYADTVDMFPKEKTVCTGLPLRRDLFIVPKKPLFTLSARYPLVYIAGGATGSESINKYIFSMLPELLTKYTLVHQTGYSSYSNARGKSRLLSKDQSSRYHIFPYISVSDLSWIYHCAKLYIGRSGGNTVGELAALGKVAILIPLPWSIGGEQEKNAQWLVEAGSAIILPQRDLPDQLLKKIDEVLSRFTIYHQHAQAFAKTIPRNGALRMCSEIQHLLS